jgi:hypothetical protein
MRRILVTFAILSLALATTGRAAPPIELELVTERGVQITAPHEWLQLLTAIGIHDVRIRTKQSGDRVQATNVGTAERPRYRVLGLLSSGDRLQLPGTTFTRRDEAALKDYFDRLAADGDESLTAQRGRFGLTDKELASITADLAQPVDFETKGQTPLKVIDRLQSEFAVKIAVDQAVSRALHEGQPVANELKNLTAGTALAIMLRRERLVLRPEKIRGQPVTLRVLPADTDALANSTLGKTDDAEIENWPIGWEPQQTPGRTAPSLFEPRNAEIEGYTLAETLAAIQPRIKVPFYFDHAALAAKQIDPAVIQVRLARTRTHYKRVIDRVLAQARLHSQIRVDEAGTPFLWITR